jgi:hypothetical protein
MARFPRLAVLLALFAAFPMVAARGQAAVPVGPDGRSISSDGSSVDDAAMLLGSVYKDERAGIRMAPPAGSRMIARAGLELVGYVQDQKQWNGTVERVILKEPSTLQQYLQNVAAEISRNFRAVQVLDSRTIKYAGKDAGRLAASMEGDVAANPNAPAARVGFFRQWLLIPTGAQEYVVVTLFAPLRDRAEATRTFDAMIANFELLDPTAVMANRAKAVAAGKAWLAQTTADQLLAKMNNQPQLFRTRIGNRDYGYIQFSEYADPPANINSAINGLHGFVMVIDSRSFPPNDPRGLNVLSVFGRNIAFWAYPKDRGGVEQPFHSVWDNLTTTNTVNPQNPQQGLAFWLREAGILDLVGPPVPAEERARLRKEREDLMKRGVPANKLPPAVQEPQFSIHVTWQGDPTQLFNDDQSRGIDTAIPAEAPAALPKILEYTWPRLVDLTKPSEMSFVVYNSQARKLALRTLAVKGKERITLNGRQINAIKCTDELDPGSTTLWVDDAGKILTMRTSDQTVLTPTTVEEMAVLWKNRAVK